MEIKKKFKYEKNIQCLALDVDVYKRQGQLLGKVKYELDGEVIAEYDITAKNSVKELDLGASFMILLRSLFHW